MTTTGKTALIIVDFQEDFCPPNGSLAVEGGRDIAPVINGLLKQPFALKVATKDFHPPSHVSFASNHKAPNNIPFKSFTRIVHPDVSDIQNLDPQHYYDTRLWPVHCVQGTAGAELVPELNISGIDVIIEKGKDPRVEMYSAFTDPFGFTPSLLKETLHTADITRVCVVGLAQDYCVKSTAIDAAKAGFETFVIREATRAVDPGEGWSSAENDMSAAGVRTVSLDEWKLQG